MIDAKQMILDPLYCIMTEFLRLFYLSPFFCCFVLILFFLSVVSMLEEEINVRKSTYHVDRLENAKNLIKLRCYSRHKANGTYSGVTTTYLYSNVFKVKS